MPVASPPIPALIRPFPFRRAALLGVTLALAGALAGCGGPINTTFPPACPHAGVLADAADVTRFRPAAPSGGGGGGQDLTDMVLDGQITGVSGSCTREDRRTLDVTVSATMRLTRGPAARGRVDDVPFFVAVSDNGQLLDKQVFRVAPGFSANADTVRLTSDPVTLTLPISPQKPGSSYDVVVGFQLTPDEVALNRRRGPR